jgi:hypothetical protein
MPVGIITQLEWAFPKHSIALSTTNPFGRTAQAIYLLTCVFELTMKLDHNSDAWYSEAESLGKTLQSFILSTVHQRNPEKNEKCHH